MPNVSDRIKILVGFYPRLVCCLIIGQDFGGGRVLNFKNLGHFPLGHSPPTVFGEIRVPRKNVLLPFQ